MTTPRTRTNITARELDVLIFKLFAEGYAPSDIDKETEQPKGYAHDTIVNAWLSNEPLLLNRRMKGIKKLEDFDKPAPAPAPAPTPTPRQQLNSIVARRYAGRKMNEVKHD